MLKEVLFVFTAAFVLWVLIFQIAVPFVAKTPFFPAFRKNRRALIEGEIASVNDDIEVQALQGHLADRQAQIKPTESSNAQ